MPPVFPLSPLTHPGFSVHRRPTFATIDHISKQGRGTGAAQQQAPLWEFELTYEVLRDHTQNILQPTDQYLTTKTELQKLLELNLACASQYGEFLFLDWTDFSRTEQPLGVGDGETTEFPFVRSITGDSGLTFTEQVGAVKTDDGVVVFVDGDEVAPGPSTWGISEDLLTLVFVDPPAEGQTISATFHYYYLCRWISDSQEVEQFANFFWAANSVRFRSVNPRFVYVQPTEITPISPSNPPTPTDTNCLHDFQWLNHAGGSSMLVSASYTGTFTCPMCQGVDKNGYVYAFENTATHSYDSNGALVATWTDADLADAIDAWYGGAIVIRGSGLMVGGRGFSVKPIKQGNYLLAYAPALAPGGFTANWFVVLNPQTFDTLDIVGAGYTVTLIGPPYQLAFNILDIANGQSDDDPILYIGGNGFGGVQTVIGVLPSVNTLSGFAGDVGPPCQYKVVVLFPVGNLDFSTKLGYAAQNGHGRWTGFIVPNSDNETLIYFYFNRGYMDFSISAVLSADKEVGTVLQPTYPLGCMVKINLGEVDYAALSGTHIGGIYYGEPTDMYSVDNANWRNLSSVSVIPFTDEYTLISHGNNIGGHDVYEMQPAAIIKRGSVYWIFFFMAGKDDALANANGQIFESFRLFEFNPTTEIATQILKDTCLLHRSVDVPFGSLLYDAFQAISLIDEDDDSITIVVHGSVYKTRFYNFTV